MKRQVAVRFPGLIVLVALSVSVLLSCGAGGDEDENTRLEPGENDVIVYWQAALYHGYGWIPCYTYVPEEPFEYITEEFKEANSEYGGEKCVLLNDDLKEWMQKELGHSGPKLNLEDTVHLFRPAGSSMGHLFIDAEGHGSLTDTMIYYRDKAKIPYWDSRDDEPDIYGLYLLFVPYLYSETWGKILGCSDFSWTPQIHGESWCAVACGRILSDYGNTWLTKVVRSITAHEIGHTFLTGHCTNSIACIMWSPFPKEEDLDEDDPDAVPHEFCWYSTCKPRLENTRP